MEKRRPYESAADEVRHKITDEKKTVSVMVGLCCKGKRHSDRETSGECFDGKGLCPDCRELLDYVFARIDRCPHMETKTFCSACETHCYSPSMRERIRAVMVYAGPRMIFVDPKSAIAHLMARRHH